MKKIKGFCYLLLFSLFIMACKSNFTSTNANIIQRKLLNDSVLRVNYTYTALGKLYEDSLEIRNKMVVLDTVPLLFSEKNPQIHNLQMPNR